MKSSSIQGAGWLRTVACYLPLPLPPPSLLRRAYFAVVATKAESSFRLPGDGAFGGGLGYEDRARLRAGRPPCKGGGPGNRRQYQIKYHTWVVAIAVCVLQGILITQGVGAQAQSKAPVSSQTDDPATEHLRLGIDFFLTHELEVAIDEFREAARLRPGLADAYHNLGVALAKSGDLKGAIAAWKKAQRLDTGGTPFRYHMSALVSYNYGVSLLREGHLETAMTEWQKAVRIQPDLAEAHYALGLGYLTLGNSPRAVTKFQESLSWHSDWAEAHDQLGVAYYEAGEFDSAEQEWRTALDLKPGFADAYSNLGLIRLHQGNLLEATKAFRQAITLDPNLAAAHFNLSVALVTEGKWNAALESLETFLRLEPGVTPAWMLRGLVWSKLGEWSRAVSDWRRALQTHPIASQAALLHYNLGVALSLMGDMQGAIGEFAQALVYRPEWTEAHYHLGVARMSTKNWTQAVTEFEKVIEHRPLWAHAYFNLGKAHYQLGAVSKAIQAYEQAVQVEPGFSDAHYQLGVTLRAQGRSAEAIEPLKSAAKGGLLEAQALLASMYANGSGVGRNLPLAMVWWFHAAASDSESQPAVDARGQLSQLRRVVIQDNIDSFESEQILAGFALIRQTLRESLPHANGYNAQKSMGRQLERKGRVAEAVPVLIQEALALDESAHERLETLYLRGSAGKVKPHDSRIMKYFIDSAKEKNPSSCGFLEKIVNQHIVGDSAESYAALQICRQ